MLMMLAIREKKKNGNVVSLDGMKAMVFSFCFFVFLTISRNKLIFTSTETLVAGFI